MTTRVAANIANARLRNNTKVGDQKMAGVKGKMTNVGQRSTLGEIGNNPTFQQTDAQKKVPSKKETSQPARGLRKNKGVTSLKAVVEEKSVTTKDVVPQMTSDLSSMDVSDVTPCDVLPVCVQDIDASDKHQPQLVSEYVNDIYTYMLELEAKFPVCPNYLKDQEINGKMRAILIDWLCQVHNRFNLLQETLYLTVAIIDRFLQHNPVGKSKLQLVSVAAMLIASKYEEMYAPEVNDFVYITDSAYSKKQILQMEQIILKKLNFSLGRPICLQFLRRNSKAGQADAKTHTLAKYLMELTLTEYDMVHYKPSQIAAAAFCLSMNLLNNGEWNETLQHYSTYSESDLIPTVQKLASLAVKAETNKLTAVRTKYSSSKLMKISTLPVLRSQTMLDLAATCS